MFRSVGIIGERAVVIIVSYERVGDPDQPDVDADMTLDGVVFPVSVTVPPEGAVTVTPETIGPIFPEYDVEVSPALFPALTHPPIVDDDVDVNV